MSLKKQGGTPLPLWAKGSPTPSPTPSVWFWALLLKSAKKLKGGVAPIEGTIELEEFDLKDVRYPRVHQGDDR